MIDSRLRLLVGLFVALLILLFVQDTSFPWSSGTSLAIRGESLSGQCTAEYGEDFAENIVHPHYGCGKEHYCWLAAWNRFLPGSVETHFGCVDYQDAQEFIESCRFALRQTCGPW